VQGIVGTERAERRNNRQKRRREDRERKRQKEKETETDRISETNDGEKE
jgi:hypothetical protein